MSHPVAMRSSPMANAARLGLTPKQHSTGGEPRSGGSSKTGNRYIRRLLHLGAPCAKHACGVTVRIMVRRRSRQAGTDRLSRKLATKETRVVALARANRMARTIVALPRDGARYRPQATWLSRGRLKEWSGRVCGDGEPTESTRRDSPPIRSAVERVRWSGSHTPAERHHGAQHRGCKRTPTTWPQPTSSSDRAQSPCHAGAIHTQVKSGL